MRKNFDLYASGHTHGPSASAAAGASDTPGASTPSPTAKIPLATSSIKTSAQINHKIGVNTTDVDAQNVTVAGGTISLKDSKSMVSSIDPSETLDKLASGDNQLTELFVPAGKQIVQINGTKPGADPWEWAGQLGSLALVDAGNNRYSPNGVNDSRQRWGKVRPADAIYGGQRRHVAFANTQAFLRENTSTPLRGGFVRQHSKEQPHS